MYKSLPKYAVAAVAMVLCISSARGLTYLEWIEGFTFPEGEEGPLSNPDNDSYINGLEFVFATDPTVPDPVEAIGPKMASDELGVFFEYRLFNDLDEEVEITLEKSDSMQPDSWSDVIRSGLGIPDDTDPVFNYSQFVGSEDMGEFYRLGFVIPYSPELVAEIQVGALVSDTWDNLDTPVLAQVFVRQLNPEVGGDDPLTQNLEENSKYPKVVGASQVSFTSNLVSDYNSSPGLPEKRSWMGWFLWGNGTPPPGYDAGYPYKKPNDDTVTPWDFYLWQFEDKNDVDGGSWTPARVDQQPLYMQPLRLNYNWAPGKHGYNQKPLEPFPNNVFYWKDKIPVRGVNLSPNYPYFIQYGDYISSPDYADAWRESWLRMKVRPLETFVMVPSVLPPDTLLQEGAWNDVAPGDFQNDYQPLPYPVFNSNLQPQEQTPYAIKTDKMGDWHADLVYEGTHEALQSYDTYRYRRTNYNEDGQGNYLKMTVAQGSPFVWCEFNASRTAPSDDDRYMIFYNLIRQNLEGSIDNNNGTNAGPVNLGPPDDVRYSKQVPGVTGVSYFLAYGDQNNPNQWYMEVEPEFADRPNPNTEPDNVIPGGFNPPGNQSNHTYFAVFYKTDAVETISTGTDAQGNPYTSLKFNDTGKNWFVVGQVPVMRYYHTEVTRDSQAVRDQAAMDWAEKMGEYAFNFLTDTMITYDVTNMYKVTTNFDAAFVNPYVAAGDPTAASMTASADETVWALFPHHYQPITLGPDLTSAGRDQVVWDPLKTTGIDFPAVAGPPNANKSDPTAQPRWDYWQTRGNMKSVVTGSFTLEYPFQNFLPAMPPPKWEQDYAQTGIQQVILSDTDDYVEITEEPTAILVQGPNAGGTGAEFKVLLEPNTGRILQVDVVNPGVGYPVGNPPPSAANPDPTKPGEYVDMVISAPPIPGGVQATARIQTDGDGKVLAVFMNNKGSGYKTTVSITQPGNEKIDPVIITPNFDKGKIVPGPANVISGGAGFDFSQPITASIFGKTTGTVGTVTIAKPGEVFGVEVSTIGGFDNAGSYPIIQDSLVATANNIRVELPPPPGGGTPPTAVVTMQAIPNLFGILIENPGNYSVAPTSAHYTNDQGVQIELTISLFQDGQIRKIDLGPAQSSALENRKQIIFVGGTVAPGGEPAEAYAYPGAAIQTVTLTGGTDGVIYPESPEVVFTGGDAGPGSGGGTFEMPEFDWSVDTNGKVVLNGFVGGNNGSGFWGPALFTVRGGRGHNAAAQATVVGGVITEVEVIRPGSNYPTDANAVSAVIRGGNGAGATVTVNVDPQGSISSIDVTNGGSGYIPENGTANVEFYATGGIPDGNASPPRGPYAEIAAQADGSGGLTNPVIRNDSGPVEIVQRGYLPNSSGDTTADTGRLFLKYLDGENRQVLSAASQGGGYIAQAIPISINVEQTFYDNIIGDYTIGMSDGVRPFGGAFGGESAPDGYGLGNQLSAATKSVNVLYHLQQEYAADDKPSVEPSRWALTQGNTQFVETPKPDDVAYTYERELPILRDHNPLFTLTGALESSVQMMQRTLSLLHQSPPYGNNPTGDNIQTWQMDYFSLYDANAGRILINPTATIPVYGVVSSVHNPPRPDGNDGKTGLNEWRPGKLWSGFGVSDQWNDQHYFFGYYLSVAGWAAIFDKSWESSITSKPSDLWADPGIMGTGLDQWYLSVAYDPDNSELLNDIYTVPQFKYQKLPFFDQWTGHGWATGVPPGPAGHREADVPWSVAVASGTGNGQYGDENENSVWEGLQAFSAAILWGAGTDRKSLVDVGLYMLATGITASDMYFQDKNYNMSDNPALNQYSWIPVTTIPSADVTKNGDNDSYPVNTSYADGARDAFYVAPPFFGGESSPGISLYRKFGPTLNNFFYAFPTGSLFILAYPPTAWTMGIARNSDFMRARYGATVREEWRAARDSALFQPGNWLGMAMTAALSGVPYNPGDEPLNEAGTALDPNGVGEYVDRLWASWASLTSRAGDEAARQPAFSSTSVLHFLHALDAYGTPDWTYLGRATDNGGTDDNASIMLLAAYSKLSDDGTSVDTTFVAFNPGWETRYASFDRLDPSSTSGGVSVANVSGVMTVPPKKMILETKTFSTGTPP